MPPPSGFVAQTPEPKTAGGIAGVFKSLTSGRGSKSTASTPLPPPSIPAAALQVAQQLSAQDPRRGVVHGGPSPSDVLLERLRSNTSVAEKTAAAEALKHAVAEYPISGVSLR